MQLNQNEYDNLCQVIGINVKRRNYQNGYVHCDGLFKTYINGAITLLNKQNHEKVVFVFLESCPSSTSNYIFGGLTNQVTKNSYLWRIYRGFFPSIPAGHTKDQCLTDLISYSRNGKTTPVIIIDLFPFHGINLKPYRQSICRNITQKNLLADVNHHLNLFSKETKRLFLFGVPFTIWNYAGGYGNGSIYINSGSTKMGLLGYFDNNTVVINVGGRNLSSVAINTWRIKEGI